MALRKAHTSAMADDVTKLLLLNQCWVTHILPHGVWSCPRLTITPTLS